MSTKPKFSSLREKIAWEKRERVERYSAYEKLMEEAHEAGLKAVDNLRVDPMVVQQHANPADDSSPVTRSWLMEDGLCGFAWVTVRPGNSSFAVYAKGRGWSTAHEGGIKLWVSLFGQSMLKKEAYARAYAGVLVQNGIIASFGSRMD